MYKGDKLIRESPKVYYEYRAGRWIRNQDEWYQSTTREHKQHNLWTADDYTFRVVKICA